MKTLAEMKLAKDTVCQKRYSLSKMNEKLADMKPYELNTLHFDKLPFHFETSKNFTASASKNNLKILIEDDEL